MRTTRLTTDTAAALHRVFAAAALEDDGPRSPAWAAPRTPGADAPAPWERDEHDAGRGAAAREEEGALV